jgi:site-specific recombinase XerD
MQLLRLKQEFLEYLELKLGRSSKTIENYERYLNRFLTFSQVKKPSEITEKKIHEFRLYLDRQAGIKVGGKVEPMNLRTQNYHLIALRSFLKFLSKREVASVSFRKIELAKVPERTLELISGDELNKLLATPPLTSLEGKRDRAILELLFSTGLRISELCDLKIEEFDLTSEELLVRGRGNKNRVVYLSGSARKVLKEYLMSRKDAEEALFIRYGKKAHIGEEARISPRTVQRLLKHYASKAGITGKVTPQVIRHCYAKELLINGTDLSLVQALLGHTNIGTTKIYTHITEASE